MTSFHDVLGTDKKTSGADVKRRYKLLSSRFHPDKGGSKALMQLIIQAYEQVNNGKGHEEAIRTVYAKNTSADSYKIKLQQLEHELQALKRTNDALNRQLEEEQKKNQQATKAAGRDATVAEDKLQGLRRENRRLKKQLEEARWELSGKACTVSPIHAEPSRPSPGEISPKVQGQIKALGNFNVRKFAAVLMLPIIIAGLLFGLGKEPWSALLAMLDEPREKPEAIVTTLDSKPAASTPLQAEPELQPVRVVPEQPRQIPRIQLESVAGVWQLRHFENSERPYIGVRSEKGSYIISTCDGGFQYYRNSNLRSSRLSANLIFDKTDRHFLVYNIPYGSGSFAANWAESKSLLINKEYFPNEGFSDAYNRLHQACSQ